MTKLKIISIIALMLIIINVHAQQPQKHEKRTYIAPNGDLFVQKELPIYLRLATSPDENAKTILLKSKISAKYSNPLYFDTDGKNTIVTPWAVDPVTKKYAVPKQEVIFEVYADGISPVTSSKFHGAPKYLKGGVTFYGKNLKVDITSRDAVSGVEKTYSSYHMREGCIFGKSNNLYR